MINAFNFFVHHIFDGIWFFTVFGISFLYVGFAMLFSANISEPLRLIRAADVKAQLALYAEISNATNGRAQK